MASNAEQLREVFRRFWEEGDQNAGHDLFARDIEWNGLEEADLGGQRHGRRAVSEFFEEWLDAWEDPQVLFEMEEMTPDIVVVRSDIRGRGKVSGIELASEIGQVWEFQDGRAVRQTMFRTYDEARAFADQLR